MEMPPGSNPLAAHSIRLVPGRTDPRRLFHETSFRAGNRLLASRKRAEWGATLTDCLKLLNHPPRRAGRPHAKRLQATMFRHALEVARFETWGRVDPISEWTVTGRYGTASFQQACRRLAETRNRLPARLCPCRLPSEAAGPQ